MDLKDNETLPRTRLAVAEYDAGEPARYARMMATRTNDEVWAAVAADKAAADKVREAFAEDTKEINSRDRAFLVHPCDPWLRRSLNRKESP